MKQYVTAIVESSVAVDKGEIRKALEGLHVRVRHVTVDKVKQVKQQ